MFDGQLEVLGVPCTQFYNKEPGSPEEIMNGVKYVRPGGGFVPSFPMFAKTDVNGANRHPLYTWLTSRCEPTRQEYQVPRVFYEPKSSEDVRWNWEKFLIDKTGQVFGRYDPGMSPLDIAEDIDTLLGL